MGRGRHHARKPFTELNIANAYNQSGRLTANHERSHSEHNFIARIASEITSYISWELYHCRSALTSN